MDVKSVQRPPFKVVGLKYHGKPGPDDIPRLWDKFGPRMGEIRHVVNPKVAYGVMDNFDMASGEFDYVAAYEVDEIADMPSGMVSMEVPAQTYAIFTCTLPTIHATYEKINNTWLVESGYERAAGPEFELYDENFDPHDPDSEMSLCIPVVKSRA